MSKLEISTEKLAKLKVQVGANLHAQTAKRDDSTNNLKMKRDIDVASCGKDPGAPECVENTCTGLITPPFTLFQILEGQLTSSTDHLIEG
jgi:hypothetical protein